MAEISKLGYHDFVGTLKQNIGGDDALKSAIGDGGFDAFGTMHVDLLIHSGLKPESYLVEIGCGSGRLAAKLPAYLAGKYLALDIVDELLELAAKLANRPDWVFVVPQKPYTIPEENGCVDMVCCFSVFTHLLHEHTYLYLQDAWRVLKPGGKLVFSFLEFQMDSHWRVFEETVASNDLGILNQFISRDAIAAWARHLDFDIEGIYDGDKPHFPLRAPVQLEDGQIFRKNGHLGQSVCVLVKK